MLNFFADDASITLFDPNFEKLQIQVINELT